MTWRYDQSTGDLFFGQKFVGTGYSGAGRTAAEGRNNGAMEKEKAKGPIPVGRYKIGAPFHHPTCGPLSMRLTPVGHKAHGRTGFLIHGDNAANDASHGCIILARSLRQLIAHSGVDALLEVTP